MRLSYKSEILTEGIADGLVRRGWDAFPSKDPGRDLVLGKADLVLAPAIDYSRHLGAVDYALVPEFAILASGFAGVMRIAFLPGREDFRRIAVRSLDDDAVLIAGIILLEKHGIEPEFIEVASGLDLPLMLESADGALLSGDDALASLAFHPYALDLADEWEDLTEQPLPYMLAWGKRGAVSQVAIEEFQSARDDAARELPDLAARHARPEAVEKAFERYLSGAIRYTIARGEADEIFNPLFHFAFYHGIITDIPSILYLPLEADERTL